MLKIILLWDFFSSCFDRGIFNNLWLLLWFLQLLRLLLLSLLFLFLLRLLLLSFFLFLLGLFFLFTSFFSFIILCYCFLLSLGFLCLLSFKFLLLSQSLLYINWLKIFLEFVPKRILTFFLSQLLSLLNLLCLLFYYWSGIFLLLFDKVLTILTLILLLR